MNDLERRVEKIEKSLDSLEKTITSLNTAIALLNQTVDTMSKNEAKRQKVVDSSFLFVIGGLISATVAWVINGGLGS